MPKHQKSQYYAVPTLVMTTPLIVSRDVRDSPWSHNWLCIQGMRTKEINTIYSKSKEGK